jgi:divalent metal cation (Fe/Co/Zn/Cd) transporter
MFVVSQIYKSKWFLVMSAYYGVLSMARGFIFLQIKWKKTPTQKLKTMRVCGGFLLLVNLVVSVMMFLLIYENRPVKHHEITVITLATYTFYSLTVAIVSNVRYAKKKNPVYFSAKMISLISASVSLVTLTNTMLATWGDSGELRAIILPLLSGAVSIFIVSSAILMMVKSSLELRRRKSEKE